MTIAITRANIVEESFCLLSRAQEDIIIKLCRELEALEERRMNEVE